MATIKPLDPDNLKYDTDGEYSETDESVTDDSAEENALESEFCDITSQHKYIPLSEKPKRFRRAILFSSQEVKDVASSSALTNYIDQNARVVDFGVTLQLPEHIVNGAVIYALRFQMACPHNTYTYSQRAAATTFLASKSEDSVRRLEAITNTYLRYENVDNKAAELRKLTEIIKLIETQILTYEGFQVNMRHPQRYLIQYYQVLKLSDKLMAHAYFVSTAMIRMTLFTLKYPMNYIGAASIKVASEWCDEKLDDISDSSCPWFQSIEANKYLDNNTVEELCEEFKAAWKQYSRFGNHLWELKKKKRFDLNHRVSNETFDMSRGRHVDKRRDAKGSWPSNNAVERKDNKVYPPHYSWNVPRKQNDRMVHSTSSSRSSRPVSPGRRPNDDRHVNHGRYPSHERHDMRTYNSSSGKDRYPNSQSHSSSHSFHGHKRSYEGGEHHLSSAKQRKT